MSFRAPVEKERGKGRRGGGGGSAYIDSIGHLLQTSTRSHVFLAKSYRKNSSNALRDTGRRSGTAAKAAGEETLKERRGRGGKKRGGGNRGGQCALLQTRWFIMAAAEMLDNARSKKGGGGGERGRPDERTCLLYDLIDGAAGNAGKKGEVTFTILSPGPGEKKGGRWAATGFLLPTFAFALGKKKRRKEYATPCQRDLRLSSRDGSGREKRGGIPLHFYSSLSLSASRSHARSKKKEWPPPPSAPSANLRIEPKLKRKGARHGGRLQRARPHQTKPDRKV